MMSLIEKMKPLQENENLKTEIRRLEALILSFRMKIKTDWMNEDLLKEYDEFFNITIQRHGNNN